MGSCEKDAAAVTTQDNAKSRYIKMGDMGTWGR